MPSEAIQIELIEKVGATGATAPSSPSTAAPPAVSLPPPSGASPPAPVPGPKAPNAPPSSRSDVVELIDSQGKSQLINKYTGNFGDRNRRFPGESSDDFGIRQNTQAKIGIGGEMASAAAALGTGPRRAPNEDISAATDLAVKGLSLLGPGAAIAGVALTSMTSVVTTVMSSLEGRAQQLKMWSPDLMLADARRNFNRMQSDMGIAQQNGPEMAKFIDQTSRLETNFSEMRAGFEKFAIDVLTPVLKKLNDLADFLLNRDSDKTMAPALFKMDGPHNDFERQLDALLQGAQADNNPAPRPPRPRPPIRPFPR